MRARRQRNAYVLKGGQKAARLASVEEPGDMPDPAATAKDSNATADDATAVDRLYLSEGNDGGAKALEGDVIALEP